MSSTWSRTSRAFHWAGAAFIFYLLRWPRTSGTGRCTR